MSNNLIKKISAILIDILLINAIFILSFHIKFSGDVPSFNFTPFLNTWYIITLLFMLMFYFFGIYSKEEFSVYFFCDLFYAISLSYFILIFFYYVLREKIGSFPTSVFLISWILNIGIISFIKFLLLNIGYRKNILFIGSRKEAEIHSMVSNKRKYNITGFMNKNIGISNISKMVINKNINFVIITRKLLDQKQFYELFDKLFGLGVRIFCSMDIVDIVNLLIMRTKIYEFSKTLMFEVLWKQPRIFEIFIKRTFDIIFSIVMLILLLPFFIGIIIAIKADSEGSIFFKQERIGKGYKKYFIYKFRTMIKNAEMLTGPVWSDSRDKRITKVGKFLRRFGIDELPQLWLVLKGDMSIVGPRPEREFFIKKYPILLSRRLSILPGITGLAQISGSKLDPVEKTKYDIAYIENRSFFFDIEVIFKTILLIIKRIFQYE